jgi:signal transduction histidine kinase
MRSAEATVSRASEPAAEQVLVLTPTGRDAEMVRDRLVADGLRCQVCADLETLLARISSGAGAVVLAHEALSPAGAVGLLAALEAQEPWSDLPVLLLSEARARTRRNVRVIPAVLEQANIIILQRPLSIQLFSSSVRSAVRARRRQYQMRELYRELARAVQVSDMFVSILGHDLRTPLGAIKLSADIIMRLAPDSPALRPGSRILSSVERMTRMIEQLLDFARVRQGRGIPLHVGRVDLGEVCRQAIQELEDANPQASIQLEEVGDICGVWDPDRLAQVVSNLVGNAVQHGTRGEPIAVEVDGRDRSTVRVSVRNFGAVPPEQLPTLFEAFKRAAAPTTTGAGRTGLGLGLFIAREIARAHGGEMLVQAAAEVTRFEVTLPREARIVDTAALTTV